MASTRTIQLEFAKQASGFGDPRLTLARPDYLEWMLRHFPLERSCRVLDVGAGTGHLSRALAPRAGWVLAVDLTIEMLRELYIRIDGTSNRLDEEHRRSLRRATLYSHHKASSSAGRHNRRDRIA